MHFLPKPQILFNCVRLIHCYSNIIQFFFFIFYVYTRGKKGGGGDHNSVHNSTNINAYTCNVIIKNITRETHFVGRIPDLYCTIHSLLINKIIKMAEELSPENQTFLPVLIVITRSAVQLAILHFLLFTISFYVIS